MVLRFAVPIFIVFMIILSSDIEREMLFKNKSVMGLGGHLGASLHCTEWNTGRNRLPHISEFAQGKAA